jgi:hypothetical protein
LQHHHRRDAGDIDIRNKFISPPFGKDALHEVGPHRGDGGHFYFRISFLKRSRIEHQRRAPMINRKLAFFLGCLNGFSPFVALAARFGSENSERN